LPIGRRPVEEKIRKEVSLFFLLLFFSLAVMVYFHVDQTRDIKQLTQEKSETDREIKRYQGRQKQLKQLENKQNVLKQKLKVIEDLRENRDLPVRVLDELATRVPADKMWIQKLTQKGGVLTIEGVARGNETIAQFMESLAQSPYFDANAVVLKQSRQVKIQEFKLKNFNLTCKVVVPPPPQATPKQPEQEGKKQQAKSSAADAA
jgi:Tfp pilus assembly protein PilN